MHMFSFRRWLLCGAVLVVITSCSSTVAPTATVASTKTTTVEPKAYRIGDVGPAGGTIFITPSTPGNMTGLYFELAPFASEVERAWATGDNYLLSVPGSIGMAIGDGAANTAAIARQAGNVAETSAAVYASEYSFNGFSDWFLPSKDELNEVYKNRDRVGGYSTDIYWSSSEFVAFDFDASAQDFGNGDQGNAGKSSPLYMRPVRAFDSLSSTAAPTTTVAPTSTTIVAPEAYQIGDVGPAGGTIFITPSTLGNTTGLYFEVAPFASEVQLPWAAGGNSELSVPGATGTRIGDGAANTAAIARQAGNVAKTSAAVYASKYSVEGFSDWFLPSKDELNEVYKNRDRVGGYSTGIHWSSSEFNADDAWYQSFVLFNQKKTNKGIELYIRPVRAFDSLSSTAAPTTIVAPEVYRIGDVGPAGGTIFITPSTLGNTTSLYFEVAPFASEVQLPWAASGNSELSVPGATGTRIGDGAANTAAIARQAGNVAKTSAAVYASKYSVEGFSDWFLPSKDELNEVYKNRDRVGGYSTDIYWSSSQFNAIYAWLQFFYNDGLNFTKKSYAYYVRPVRAFDGLSSTAAPTTTVAPTSTTTMDSKSYRIGDVGPAGGTIFITPSTLGNTTGLYFEAAPFASEVERAWVTGGNQSLSVPSATGTRIGDGAANTAAIARQAGNVAKTSAAVYASKYSVEGFSDWFLPSKDELNEVYKNRDRVGGFSSDFHWSSSELIAGDAWAQGFASGSQLPGWKGHTLHVRPVRAFG